MKTKKTFFILIILFFFLISACGDPCRTNPEKCEPTKEPTATPKVSQLIINLFLGLVDVNEGKSGPTEVFENYSSELVGHLSQK